MNQHIKTEVWTDERIEELKRLWTDGFSAAAISERIGGTRNAILGKANRLGLSKPGGFWSDEKVNELKDLFSAGYSLSLIAERLGGPSKRAVMSKCERLGLLGRERAVRFRKNNRTGVAWRHPRRSRFVILTADIPKPSDQFKCSLIDLENDTCRWPLWNDDSEPKFYCGTPEADCREGRPYCRWHTVLGTRRTEEIQEIPFR